MTPNWPGGPPPGWYPDPSGEKAWRWWDGQAWTAHASDPTPGGGGAPGYASPSDQRRPPAYPSTGYPGAGGYPTVPSSGYGYAGYGVIPPHEQFAAEEKAAPWARRAFFGYLLILAFAGLFAWAVSAPLHQIIHSLQVQARTGIQQPLQTTQTTQLNLLSGLSLLVEVPFYVLILMWQYKAAKTAQLLRLSARRSPGLGVGSWFIPIVNFWFPYQAISDCLPPGDGGRKVVDRMWAFFIATLVTNGATVGLAFAGTPVAFGAAAVTLLLGLGFAVNGARAVTLIGHCHRGLLYPAAATRSDAAGPVS